MKFLLIAISILANISYAGSMKLLRGGIDGGGADHYNSSYGSAWFLKGEKEKIGICIKMKDGLSISQSQLEATIKDVYNQWDKYIEENSLYDVDTIKAMKIETAIEMKRDCKNSDLEIYFGVSNNQIDKLKQKFNEPTAFTHRYNYDTQKGWSRGVIWISDNFKDWAGEHGDIWNIGNNLYMILLHEIGHTFGNPHKPRTIMERDIVDLILVNEPENKEGDDYYKKILKRQKEIDWESTVIPCFECVVIGTEGRIWLEGSDHEKITFRLLSGRNPIGKVETSYKFDFDPVSMTVEGFYFLKDELETKKYPVKFYFGSSSLKTDPFNTFNRYRELSENGNVSIEHESSGGISLATIYGYIEVGPKKYNIVMENEMFGIIIKPPYGETSRNDENLLINEAARSIYLLDSGHKYFLYSKVKKYVMNNPLNSCELEEKLNIRLR